jgi:hypothetical protein
MPLTLAAMSLGYGVVQLDVTIVNTALGSIGASLGGGVSGLQWVQAVWKCPSSPKNYSGWAWSTSDVTV